MSLAEVPLGLKLALLCAWVPSWLFDLHCVLAGQDQTTAQRIGVRVGVSITLLALTFARRSACRLRR